MLEKADLVHISIWEAFVYMTDHLDYESRDLSISYPSPEEEKEYLLYC